jgi:hypothetical protein
MFEETCFMGNSESPDCLPGVGDNSLEFHAQEIKNRIGDLATHEKRSLELWAEIGQHRAGAKQLRPNTKEFGAWIRDQGIKQLPGLESNGSISDAIWCAESPTAVAEVVAKYPNCRNPRAIRAKWLKAHPESVKKRRPKPAPTRPSPEPAPGPEPASVETPIEELGEAEPAPEDTAASLERVR